MTSQKSNSEKKKKKGFKLFNTRKKNKKNDTPTKTNDDDNYPYSIGSGTSSTNNKKRNKSFKTLSPHEDLAIAAYKNSNKNYEFEPTTSKSTRQMLGLEPETNTTYTTTTTTTRSSKDTTTNSTTTNNNININKPSWLCKTNFFKSMSNSAFDVVDADGSGSVDETELYSGLLLIHLKLGCYAGPAACRPISREQCKVVFHKMDIDQSNTLDRNEFHHVMMVLFGNVLLRVFFQYTLTLILVPLIAKTVLDGIYMTYDIIYKIINDTTTHIINEYDDLESDVENLNTPNSKYEFFIVWLIQSIEKFITIVQINTILSNLYSKLIIQLEKTGQFYIILQLILTKFQYLLSKIPDSVLQSLPLTLLSTILSLMVVPWTLLKTDTFFSSVAEKEKRKKKEKSE